VTAVATLDDPCPTDLHKDRRGCMFRVSRRASRPRRAVPV
jgi:hypothetical protein